MRKTLVFIAGAEGSGTTMLQRVLGATPASATAGYKFAFLPDDPSAAALFDAAMTPTARMWDRAAPLSVYLSAKVAFREALEHIDAAEAFSDRTHLVLKQSFPFELPHGRRMPDLLDVLDARDDARIVAIYRDPCAAVYSALRRKFDDDLRRLAFSCTESLTWLAGQVKMLGSERVRIISYDALCHSPETALAPIAEFCSIPLDAIVEATRNEHLVIDADRRYASELAAPDIAWLDGFFDARRRRQWDVLSQA